MSQEIFPVLPPLTRGLPDMMEDLFITSISQLLAANIGDETYVISNLCREMAISRTQLYRKFRLQTGTTPNQYFLSIRLQKARELLGNPGVTVAEAAYKTGFKNISHFSQAFSRQFGTPPSEVRK